MWSPTACSHKRSLVNHEKPGREHTPFTCDLRAVLHTLAPTTMVSQFSYTGLKAFGTERNGAADLDTFFTQLLSEYLSADLSPCLFFCILRLKDFYQLSDARVISKPDAIRHDFFSFFAQLCAFSPRCQIFWLGSGNVFSASPAFNRLDFFCSYLQDWAILPHWLTFCDVTFDCKDFDVKDAVGNSLPHYLHHVADRVCFKIISISNIFIVHASQQFKDARYWAIHFFTYGLHWVHHMHIFLSVLRYLF